ncbi:MAG: NYN domain-containing protein [Burkholderiales bacterium]|nr:NYN domain-containing protein [Burkholderiales bacterium]
MSTPGRKLFLIDADNVAVEVIEKALAMKQALHGPIHVKRCYCSADFAVKNLAFLKENSIRAMVNVTAGKNCTDIALAIDAVQLCEYEVPTVVVIIGSDSDFAPLVMHLRDRGCRVEGVGQEGKVGAESHLAYDDFISLPVGRGRTAKSSAAAPTAAAPPPRRSSRAPAPAPVPAPVRPRLPAVPADVERWLGAVPGLASGESVELKVAAEALRKEKLLSRNASSTTLFKKHPDWFELMPSRQPNSVRYRRSS